jgi:hypothetical protein
LASSFGGYKQLINRHSLPACIVWQSPKIG